MALNKNPPVNKIYTELQKTIRLNLIGCFLVCDDVIMWINVIGHLSRQIPSFLYIFLISLNSVSC